MTTRDTGTANPTVRGSRHSRLLLGAAAAATAAGLAMPAHATFTSGAGSVTVDAATSETTGNTQTQINTFNTTNNLTVIVGAAASDRGCGAEGCAGLWGGEAGLDERVVCAAAGRGPGPLHVVVIVPGRDRRADTRGGRRPSSSRPRAPTVCREFETCRSWGAAALDCDARHRPQGTRTA